MYKKICLAILMVALISISTAAAQVVPNCQFPDASLSVVQGGNTVLVSGVGFTPCHAVTVYLDEVELPYVGDVVSLQGSFTLLFVVANDTPLGTHIVKVSDNFGHTATTPIIIVSSQGPKGDTGEIGATGPQGNSGASFNATGDVFLFNGTNGAAGADFNTTQPYTYIYNGTQGPKGDTGYSITGPRGQKGEAGENAVGEQGPMGSAGPQGPAGKDGLDGQTTSGDFQGAVLAGLLAVIAAFTVLLALVILWVRRK